MDMVTGNSHEPRQYDLAVFGATGLTGRLVVRQLAGMDAQPRGPDGKRLWAAVGRNREQVTQMLAELELDGVDILVADLDQPASLQALARRTTAVVNLAGPYTQKAASLIEACVEAGTSYVDLSGEIPFLRRVIDRFDASARAAGVQVVQMAGWEAMPADLTTLVACRRAVGDEAGADGPGAADPIAEVVVSVTFTRRPEGGVPFRQQVSAGTMASVVAMLDDPDAALVGHADALLPDGTGGGKADRLRFGASDAQGRVLGPVPPVAFLNPPIIRRTAALLAAGRNAPYSAASYVEGEDMGGATLAAALGRQLKAKAKGELQQLAVAATGLPLAVRQAAAAGLRQVLPEAGTGPSNRFLEDWAWRVEARATAKDGRIGTSSLEGTGHPGYTATAAIIVEVALHVLDRDRPGRHLGCVTPALAIGASAGTLRVETLSLR
ncbi:saccharopine dehydrogenase NADP-binding domain-containing protein [Sphingomonas sp.]|uniref:saccharopine dehydrogenase NADP-binding domain-containing protein n=1 Tax=Sphingomonas sp. TaxID=28214 RepID=UPI003B0088DD